MGVLIVPPLDEEPWPTLGPAIADFIEDRAIFGPGSLQRQPAKLDIEKRAALYRLYEVYPKGHELAGRRRFKRGGISWRKGLAKTEFGAWVTLAELHPEGPVRCDGFDAYGDPVGRPVVAPYIPMMATTEEQVQELAFGVLHYIVTEGDDADLFDAGLDRIIRLSDRGRADGMAVPVSTSPNGRDGARTTFQYFDEPHRLTLPGHHKAYETMMANLEKRPLEDPWAFSTSTAGQPGQGSIEENTYKEAQDIDAGLVQDPALFYFHRDSSGDHDLKTMEGRVAAIAEATGPVGEYGPGQFQGIAKQWDRKGVDKSYLERVWLNRWRKSAAQAFDLAKWTDLGREGTTIPKGSWVTLGFDGARFRDATALVMTDIRSGLQTPFGLWESPADPEAYEREHGERWEVPEAEVTAKVAEAFRDYDVYKLYGDPPHWTETLGSWNARWPDQVEEFWTANKNRMAYTLREFVEAIDAGIITHTAGSDADADYARHIGNAGRKDLKTIDDEGQPLWVLMKQEMDMKFDQAMAGVLSWKAAMDARKDPNARPRRKPKVRVRRIR